MAKQKFEFEILDSFNADYRENGAIAYVFYFGDPWLEISHIDGEIVMYICKHPRERCWQMPYKDAIEALEKIQREIKSRQQKK